MSIFYYKPLDLPKIDQLSLVDPLKFEEFHQLVDGTIEGFQVIQEDGSWIVPIDSKHPNGSRVEVGNMGQIIRHFSLPEDILEYSDEIVSRINFISSNSIFSDIALKIQGGRNVYLGLFKIKQTIIKEFLGKNLARILEDQEIEQVNRLFLGV